MTIQIPAWPPLKVVTKQRKTGEWTLTINLVDFDHMEQWRQFFIRQLGHTKTPQPKLMKGDAGLKS